MVYLDDQARELISEIAEIELASAKNDSAKERWLELANHLQQLGTEKHDVSKTITRLVQKQMKTRDPEAKFNNGYFYRVMKESGYTDQEYHTKEVDQIRPEADQKTVPLEPAPEKPAPRDITIKPSGRGIDAILLMKEISLNNINNINKVLVKTTFQPALLRDMKRDEPDSVQEKFLKTQKDLVDKRLEILNESKELQDFNAQSVIRKQKQVEVHLDDRVTVTQWEKVMALLAMQLGYDRNEIARLLGVTTKHMKINIVPEESKKHILQLLDWFKRCPSCGSYLADFFEGLIKSKVTDLPKDLIPEDIDYLRLTDYQNENIKLKKQVRELKSGKVR